MSVELFPLGTVVKLKGVERLMMICGYASVSVSVSDVGEIFDYSGFVYPEGYADMKKVYQFNNAQIEGIIALGYQDRETNAFLKVVGQKLHELRTKNETQKEN